MTTNITQWIQDRINMYNPASFKFPSQARAHQYLFDHWQEMAADWDAYLRGEKAKHELHLDLQEKMSNFVMPEWGYKGS